MWLVLLEQTKMADPKVFQSVALALYYLAVDSGERKTPTHTGTVCDLHVAKSDIYVM